MFNRCPGSQTRCLVRKYGAGAILTQAGEPKPRRGQKGAAYRREMEGAPGLHGGWRSGHPARSRIPEILEVQPPRGSGDRGVPAGGAPLCRGIARRSSASRACTTSRWEQPATVTYTTGLKAAICRWPSGRYRLGNCPRRPVRFDVLATRVHLLGALCDDGTQNSYSRCRLVSPL